LRYNKQGFLFSCCAVDLQDLTERRGEHKINLERIVVLSRFEEKKTGGKR